VILCGRQAAQVLAVEGDGPLGGDLAGDGRRSRVVFPGAVGADDGDDLALGDLQGHALQRLEAAIGGGNAVKPAA
jgi:hypothetical protein